MKASVSEAGQIFAVILAGGAGRRIGGGKATRLLAGRMLWRHVADCVGVQVAGVAINAPMSPPGAGLEVVPDPLPGLGPLSGVLAALDWAQGRGMSRVLTVPVDTPFLPDDLVVRLARGTAPVCMAETADGAQGTCALWSVDLAGDLRHALRQGVRKVTSFAQSVGVDLVHFPNTVPPAFFNINTAQDLERAEAWLR